MTINPYTDPATARHKYAAQTQDAMRCDVCGASDAYWNEYEGRSLCDHCDIWQEDDNEHKRINQ